jgi:anti-anti-sigma factor
MEHGYESPVQVDVNWNGMVATVTVTGDLDIATATPLTERLRAVAARRPEWLVLDLSGLVFVDVTSARALYDAYALLQTACPVILREPRPSPSKIFGLTRPDGGLDNVWTFRPPGRKRRCQPGGLLGGTPGPATTRARHEHADLRRRSAVVNARLGG